MILRLLLLVALTAGPLLGQHRHDPDRAIEFPDIPGFQTLTVDLHIHSVFSDGSVWPNIRVEEAIRDGLDAISLTEHLEYQPHQEDIPHPDRNRSFEIASEVAADHDLMILHGSEITRDMPPGHNNTIFIQDANKLLIEDSLAVFEEAARQGGFTFWDHPNWTSQRKDGVARLTDFHRELIEKKLLHGIEVVNDITYSDEALQIALDNNLTIMGTSDIHGLVDWQYKVPEGGHRPITMVFAEERSPDGIKAGLFAGRTAVWYRDYLVGKDEWLVPLLESSLQVTGFEYPGDTSVMNVTVMNHSDAPFTMRNLSEYTMHDVPEVFSIAPHGETVLMIKTLDRLESAQIELEVMNAVTAPGVHPTVTLSIGG